jgi:hypothetical protein
MASRALSSLKSSPAILQKLHMDPGFPKSIALLSVLMKCEIVPRFQFENSVNSSTQTDEPPIQWAQPTPDFTVLTDWLVNLPTDNKTPRCCRMTVPTQIVMLLLSGLYISGEPTYPPRP